MAWHAGIGVAAQNLRVLRGQVGDSAADADGLATLERERTEKRRPWAEP